MCVCVCCFVNFVVVVSCVWVGLVGVVLLLVFFGWWWFFDFGLFVVVLGWAGVVFLGRDCERLLVAKDLAI